MIIIFAEMMFNHATNGEESMNNFKLVLACIILGIKMFWTQLKNGFSLMDDNNKRLILHTILNPWASNAYTRGERLINVLGVCLH